MPMDLEAYLGAGTVTLLADIQCCTLVGQMRKQLVIADDKVYTVFDFLCQADSA
jgi:hypothetical protein